MRRVFIALYFDSKLSKDYHSSIEERFMKELGATVFIDIKAEQNVVLIAIDFQNISYTTGKRKIIKIIQSLNKLNLSTSLLKVIIE